MKREIVNSGKIKSIGYGIFSSKLEIEFITGEIVQFFKVPYNIFEGIKIASSCCEYYEKNINGIFKSKLLEDKF